ncbi:Serine carboxypeptidase-like 40 [Zea mays]|uniref:Serine carboxypeptidase-like 40 n=1 Tax=Zea mays TaxID=4577 RepID=A0A3L6DXN2_MAIZE|nr:Serine carboxypeptidase-like 40 [Zea mays]
MRSISACCFVLLIVCLLGSHANSSQEARLREFILSRRSSGSAFSVHDESAFTATSRLRSEYSGTDQSAQKAADKITALPGQPGGVGFDQYSGYVTVDEESGRALFYYFVEAARDASAKPLLLWLNGGPGCSSVGYGAMIEIGPFRITSDNKTLSRNENAWNSEANVLFLESPAGVGFSYSNTSSDYGKSGDQRTADDAFVFLINWLERFPEYKARAFYISGESYAAHYGGVWFEESLHPKCGGASWVHSSNLVGNAYLDDNKNTKGQIDYLWSHGVISDQVCANITKNCKFSLADGDACSDAMAAYDSGYISGYNIYAPVCIDNPNGNYYPSSNVPGIDPCSNYYIQAYMNNPLVQKAFHARTTEWSGCTNLHWKDAPVSMTPTIKWLLGLGLPVWLYSGDFDAVCPLTATRYSIADLELSVMEPWRPWTATREVGGYVQQYTGGLVLISVRGAGHQVPYFRPERALVLLRSFLKGTLPPYVVD